jgi:hypothetical protein
VRAKAPALPWGYEQNLAPAFTHMIFPGTVRFSNETEYKSQIRETAGSSTKAQGSATYGYMEPWHTGN